MILLPSPKGDFSKVTVNAMWLGFVGGSWSRGARPLVQNLRRLLAQLNFSPCFSSKYRRPSCFFGVAYDDLRADLHTGLLIIKGISIIPEMPFTFSDEIQVR